MPPPSPDAACTMARTSQMDGLPRDGLTAATPIFAVGEHDDDDREAEDEPETEPDEDTDDAPAHAPMTALRVAHFSPDAPAVDVYVDDDRVIAGLEYESITPYLELEPGTYTFTVTPADEPEQPVIERTTWVGRAFYTIAAIGSVEMETLRPHILIDDGSALLRAVHAVPDAPAVDLFANGGDTPIVSDLEFGTATGYVALPAASYTIDVRPAGTDDTVDSFDVDLERGFAYSGVAIGLLEDEAGDRPFTLRALVDGPLAAMG